MSQTENKTKAKTTGGKTKQSSNIKNNLSRQQNTRVKETKTTKHVSENEDQLTSQLPDQTTSASANSVTGGTDIVQNKKTKSKSYKYHS